MPRIVLSDWIDAPIPSRADYLRAQAQRLTRQGVRDLNGPNCNGRGYNGRRTA